MTFKAREVLEDCKIALQLLEDEKDVQRWRINWVAALALIRAVGHVLDKVDAKRNCKVKEISKSFFKEWKSDESDHVIFRDFIEKERNSILKEYDDNTHPFENVPIVVHMNAISLDGEKNIELANIVEIGDNIYRPLLEGYYAGIDARDVLSEAIVWWELQLQAIDDTVEKLQKE